MKIIIIGLTGSGKSTLAQTLAKRFCVEYVSMDDLYHLPGWTTHPTPVFVANVLARLADAEERTGGWVTDGNYKEIRFIMSKRCNTLIYLDYHLLINLIRLTFRSWERITRRQMICNGNYETWYKLLCTKDSLYYWACTHCRPNRVRWSREIQDDSLYGELTQRIRLISPTDTEDFLTSFHPH